MKNSKQKKKKKNSKQNNNEPNLTIHKRNHDEVGFKIQHSINMIHNIM